LAGPIFGCADDQVHAWRRAAKDYLSGVGTYDPALNDDRGHEAVRANQIVRRDKTEIVNSAVVLANLWRPSVGTSMEIFWAASIARDVVVCCDANGHWSSPENFSPWILSHATHVASSLSEACFVARGICEE